MPSSPSSSASLALLVLVALTAGGCKYYWGKPGASVESFQQDHRECARASAETPTSAAAGVVDLERYRACLAARGWERREQTEPPPPGWFRGFER